MITTDQMVFQDQILDKNHLRPTNPKLDVSLLTTERLAENRLKFKDIKSPSRWPRLLKRADAAEYLGISVRSFDQHVKSGSLPKPTYSFSDHLKRWDRSALDKYIDAKGDAGPSNGLTVADALKAYSVSSAKVGR